jgi:hypothetical protein
MFCLIYKNLGVSRSDKPGQNARLGERAVKAIEIIYPREEIAQYSL